MKKAIIFGIIFWLTFKQVKTVMAFDNKFYQIVIETAKVFPIDPVLVMAIMEVESEFNPMAYRGESHINDASRGLMQVLLGTARGLGYTGQADGLFVPEINIYYGMKFLDDLQRMFPGNEEAVIMSYNEGPGNYKRGNRVWSYYGKVMAAKLKWKGVLNV